MALTIWSTSASGPVPTFTALSADLVLEELGSFSKSSVTLPGSDAAAVALMADYTLLEIEQDGVGTLGFWYVLRPSQAITINDDHTITLELDPLPVELTWRHTHRDWTASNKLSVVASRLGSLVSGWQGVYTNRDTYDPDVVANLNNPTILAGFLSVAKQYSQFVRQGIGVSTTLKVAIPNGSDTSHIQVFDNLAFPNSGTLIIEGEHIAYAYRDALGFAGITRGMDGTTAQQHPAHATVTSNATNGAPTRIIEMGQFGAAPTCFLTSANGGNAEDMEGNPLNRLVATIERHPNDVDTLVNVTTPFGGGQTSDTLVTLERLWRIINDGSYINHGRWGTDTDSIARTGLPSLFPEYDDAYPISDPENPPTGTATFTADGTLIQGALGTRYFTLSGRADYMVYDRASYATYGYKDADYTDSSLNYPDSSVANQEVTARALYVSAITNFKRRAHPHHSVTCTAPGLFRPTRAGDLICVDYQRQSVNMETGYANVELAMTENLRVMKVTRSFAGDAVPMDTYILSNTGRFDDDDATAATSQAQTLISLQRQQGTGLAPYNISFTDNVDAANPMTLYLIMPDELFQWHRVRLRVDFLPYRATAATLTNASGTVSQTSAAANIGGMPKHQHRIHVLGGGHAAPTTDDQWMGALVSGTDIIPTLNNTTGLVNMSTDVAIPVDTVDLTPTTHSHTVPLPQHTHPLEQRIPTGGTLPVFCAVKLGSDYLVAGLKLLSGTRRPDGAFTTSFEVDNIGPFLELPGQTIPLQLEVGTGPGNLSGTGRLQVTLAGVAELGGLTSTVVAS